MNKMLIGVVIGALGTALVAALVGYMAIQNGWLPARGDVVPDKFESWAAHHALHAVLNREGTDKAPFQADAPTLLAGAKVYGANCSGCHGAPGNPTPSFAAGFNPSAPYFADGMDVTDDPEGHIYWIVNHGIKFTGMPSFNKMLNEKEMWQVTLFLKNQNKLPAEAAAFWKTMK
jgi:mono/diheme cytochrome c family protein